LIQEEKERALREARAELSGSGNKRAGAGDAPKAEERKSVMGTLSGRTLTESRIDKEVEERQGPGVLTRQIITREVQRRVQADYRKVKRCSDEHGTMGSIQLTLFFTDKGSVRTVEVRPSNPPLEKCIESIAGSWRIDLISQPVQIPITLRFQ
jgi:hypothetical protein